MPTTRIYPHTIHGSMLQALPQIARFLNNRNSTYTGPGWQIVQAYSNGVRDVPNDPGDIDTLLDAVGWANGSVSVGDWIVLESQNSLNTNHFQVCLFAAASGSANIMMLPQCGFNTDAPAGTPPAFPTASFGLSSGTVYGVASLATSASYSVVADEGMAAFVFSRLDGIPRGWTYFGEVDSTRVSGSPPDDRPYVVWTNTSGVYWDDSTATSVRTFNRYSPLQVSGTNTWLTGTINGGAPAYFEAAGGSQIVHNTTNIDTLLGTNSILPVGVNFGTGIHRHFMGFLRNVYSMHADVTSSAGTTAYNGTTAGRHFRYNNSLSGSDAALVIAWDGSTAFP